MRARDAEGKLIRRIAQRRLRVRTHTAEFAWHLDEIVLHDGTRLVPNVRETDFGDYIVELHAVKGGGARHAD